MDFLQLNQEKLLVCMGGATSDVSLIAPLALLTFGKACISLQMVFAG